MSTLTYYPISKLLSICPKIIVKLTDWFSSTNQKRDWLGAWTAHAVLLLQLMRIDCRSVMIRPALSISSTQNSSYSWVGVSRLWIGLYCDHALSLPHCAGDWSALTIQRRPNSIFCRRSSSSSSSNRVFAPIGQWAAVVMVDWAKRTARI